VGFPRSGTSLTYRIYRNHPEVEKMVFEKWLLLNKHLMQGFVPGRNCGEKVIYAKRVIGKIGRSTYNIVDYCNDWNKLFKDEARIVQIIRYPLDSLNSLAISKKRFPRGPKATRIYKEYLEYIPKYTFEISKLENCFTIKYEDLVSRPEENIRKLFLHCGLEPVKANHKMRGGRVFNYFKKKKFLLDWDPRINNIIESFNQYGGIEYKKI
jgi:hypothetical protein